MKIKLIITVFLFGLISMAISCSKEHPLYPESETTYSFSPDALAYGRLTQGKYFIYKDSATGFEDSIIVSRSEVITEHATNGLFGWNQQTYYLELSKPYMGSNFQWMKMKAVASTSYYGYTTYDSCQLELFDISSF